MVKKISTGEYVPCRCESKINLTHNDLVLYYNEVWKGFLSSKKLADRPEGLFYICSLLQRSLAWTLADKLKLGILAVFERYGTDLKCKKTGVYFRPLILNFPIFNRYLKTVDGISEPKEKVREDYFRFLSRKAKTLLPKSELTIPCKICNSHLNIKVCFLHGVYRRTGWQSTTNMTVHLPLCSNHYDAVIRNNGLRIRDYNLILNYLRTTYHVQFISWFVPKTRGNKKLNKS